MLDQAALASDCKPTVNTAAYPCSLALTTYSPYATGQASVEETTENKEVRSLQNTELQSSTDEL